MHVFLLIGVESWTCQILEDGEETQRINGPFVLVSSAQSFPNKFLFVVYWFFS